MWMDNLINDHPSNQAHLGFFLFLVFVLAKKYEDIHKMLISLQFRTFSNRATGYI
jgi:hypothetical protein